MRLLDKMFACSAAKSMLIESGLALAHDQRNSN
jgi:hypothetical protein